MNKWLVSLLCEFFLFFIVTFLYIQKQRLEESTFEQQKMEGSIKMFTEEKEDLAMVA